jgi:hypothetical protein
MTERRYKIRLFSVAAFLLLQLAGAAHVYSHDPGTPQGSVCVFCSVADNLHAVGPAAQDAHTPHLPQEIPEIAAVEQFSSAATLSARQRGPPTTS